jgi:mRNA interferase RelE/StbE
MRNAASRDPTECCRRPNRASRATYRPLARQRIVTTIGSLAHNPRPVGVEKLSGDEKYRIRQGDYRILYEIVDATLIVTVVRIGNRREVYRR